MSIDDYKAGDFAEESIFITEDLIKQFIHFSGDDNPVHSGINPDGTATGRKPVAHGMLSGIVASRLVGTKLPGYGSLWSEQNFKFKAPIYLGDEVVYRVTILEVFKAAKLLKISFIGTANGIIVVDGDGFVAITDVPELKDSLINQNSNKKTFLLIGGTSEISNCMIENIKDDADILNVFTVSRTKAHARYPDLRSWTHIEADVTSIDGVKRIVEQLNKSIVEGTLNILYGVAGNSIAKSIWDVDRETLLHDFKLQVLGLHELLRGVLGSKNLAEVSTNICAISSIYTERVRPKKLGSYIVCKSALESYCRSLAIELPSNFRINCIRPGLLDSPINAYVPNRIKMSTKINTPTSKLTTAQDVADLICFLFSDQSGQISGETINVSGGY